MSAQQSLPWPETDSRTPAAERESGRFDVGFRRTKREIGDTFERMGVTEWQLHTVSGSRSDPGVVLTWTDEHGPHTIADDQYNSKKANLRNCYLWLRAQRKSDDRNIATAGSDALAAAALPSGSGDDDGLARPPHEILGLPKDASDPVVRARFKQLVKEGHADQGGDADIQALKTARDRLTGETDA